MSSVSPCTVCLELLKNFAKAGGTVGDDADAMWIFLSTKHGTTKESVTQVCRERENYVRLRYAGWQGLEQYRFFNNVDPDTDDSGLYTVSRPTYCASMQRSAVDMIC